MKNNQDSNKPINKTMDAREWALLILLSIAGGGSFYFVGVAVEALPPFTIVVLRVGLAALVLNLVVLALGLRMPRDLRTWAAFAAMGVLNNLVPFTLIVWGQSHIAAGLASILNATTPLFTVILAHFLTSDEKLGGGRVAGVAVGFAGVVLMIGAEALAGLGVNLVAQLAVLGATLSYAFAAIFGRRFGAMGTAPLVSASGQLTASTVMLIPVAAVAERPWTLALPGPEIWGAVIGLALFSTVLLYILYFRLLATAGATNLLLFTLLIPVSAILLSATLLGERLEPKHFAGMALIGVGLGAIDGRPLGALRRRFTPSRAPAAAAPRASGEA